MNTFLNVVVAAVLLGFFAFTGWNVASELYNSAPAETVAYAGFGALVAGIVGVGSALLSPRRF